VERRVAAAAGVAGPVGFLCSAFLLSALRHDLIAAQGWASWPSSMALDGRSGIPMIAAFLWLAGCYVVFALGALRPALAGAPAAGAAWGGFLGIAAGDVLLAFPTDGPGAATTWHGGVHLGGVLLATAATLVAATGVTRATRGRRLWTPWRWTAPVPFAAAALGLAAGFDSGWAKVLYVVTITAPAAVVGWCVLRADRAGEPVTAARSG
jgi:hypothetical protein